MPLRPDQLANHLDKGLAPIYLVSGSETLLVQECCDAIRLQCRRQQFSREVLHVEAGFDWNELLASAAEMSLFAEQKLIELRLPTGKPGDAGSKALVQYAANAPAENVLLIICNKLESATTRSKWYKAIDKAGTTVQCWPVDARQLPRWINQRLQQAGLRADNDAIQMLADRVEGNLLAAAQEIEKLKLYGNETPITVDKVSASVANNARYDLFALVDKSLQGDTANSLKMLRGLKAEGTEAPVVLWALARELRVLFRCAEQITQGNGVDRVLQNQRVWDKRKALTKNALNRLQAGQLKSLLTLANQADQAIKGINRNNSWDLLEQLIVKLSSPAAARLF